MQNNKKLVNLQQFKIFCFENDWYGRDIINGKIWEPHILQTILLLSKINNECFIDCGSNYGWHTIYASKIFKRVHSFEPQKIIYEMQSDSLKLNNIVNVTLYNKALGNEQKIVYLPELDYSVDMNMGDTSISPQKTTIEINQIRLNDVEDDVSLIKMDVQGYEKFVIEGASRHLTTTKPFIIIEIEEHQLRKFNISLDQIFDMIRQYGDIYLIDYLYPSDFIIVPYGREKEFNSLFKDYTYELQNKNDLNRCMDFNVQYGIKFSDDISLNRVKRISYEIT